MSEFVTITINGQRFHMTKEEAQFLSTHLNTAVVNPGAALCFNRRPQRAQEQLITVERGPQSVAAYGAAAGSDKELTDC